MEQSVAAAVSQPETSTQIRKGIGYFAAFIALGLAYAPLGPTLTELAARTHVDLNAISYIFTARSFGYLFGSFFGGRLYDRVKGNPLMAATLLLTALMLILTPMISVLWVLVGVIMLMGLFEGVIDVGGNTLLVWTYRDKVGPYMNALHFFFGVGAFLSPIIVAQAVLLSGDIAWAYWVLALLILPVAVVLLRLPSPAAQSEGEVTSNDDVVRMRARVNGVLVALVAVFYFLYVGSEGSFGDWIATYAKAMNLGNATTAAYLTSAFWGAMMLGRLLSIPIAARFTPRQVLWGDLVGCLVSVGLIVVWPGSPVAVWIGTFGAGLFMASIFPTVLSFAERYMTITGKITGWFFVGGSTGGMTLPWLIGQLFESVGPRVTVFAILTGVALDLAVFGTMLFYIAKHNLRVNQRVQ